MSGNHNAYQFKGGSVNMELIERLRNPAYTGLGDIAADLIEAQAKEISEVMSANIRMGNRHCADLEKISDLQQQLAEESQHTTYNALLVMDKDKEIDDLYKLKLEIALLQRVANEDQAEINELRAALVECQSAMTQATKPPCACFAGCDNCDLEPNANDLMRAALTRCMELIK